MTTRDQALANLESAEAAPRCTHIKVDGQQCGSPALRGTDYCYYHVSFIHSPDALFLPPIEDGNSLQVILHGILTGLRDDRLDPKRAAQMLWALQIATANLNNTTMQPDLNLARQLTAIKTRSEHRRDESITVMKARIESQLAASKELVQHRSDVANRRPTPKPNGHAFVTEIKLNQNGHSGNGHHPADLSQPEQNH